MAGTPFHTARPLPMLAAAALVLACLAAFTAFPPAAHAVSLFVRPDVPCSADVRAGLTAAEPEGVALLFVDGAVVRTAAIRPSAPATFAAVPLAPGAHLVRVAVRSSGGIAFSTPATVRAWTAPAVPSVSGVHAGLYPVDAPLTIATGAGTTKVTATLAGRGVWTKPVSAPTRFSYTFRLPPGRNTLVVASANPIASAGRTVTLDAALWPTPGYTRVSSEFGPRGGRMHKGIDIPAPEGSKVLAVAEGRVLWAEKLTSYGGLVMIDHGNKLTTYYAHLSHIDVKLGQWVRAGDRIGAVGVANTAHLHFQTFSGGLGWNDTSDKYRRVNSGTPVDPRIYVGHP